MKKTFLAFAFILLASSYVGICNAQSLTVGNCREWKTYLNAKNPQNLENIESEQIKTLHDEQFNTTSWTSDVILRWSWDDINEGLLLDTPEEEWPEFWNKHEVAFLHAARECDYAIYAKKREKRARLKKTELYIEQAIIELRKAHTAARIPWVPNGGILPGSTRKGEAADYVENKFIPKFVNGTLALLIVLSVLMLIIGGMMYLFASGDQELVDKAKTTITWAIVGTVITILSYAIVQFVIGIDFSI